MPDTPDDMGRRYKIAIAATLIAALLLVPMLHIAYINYNFAVDIHHNIDKAAESGSPEEMHTFLTEAREGMVEHGYDGGQYAYILQTPSTNTTVDYRVMDSYIDRSERLANDNNDTRVSIGLTDLRRGIQGEEDSVGRGIGIDTTDWWAHHNPLNFIWHRIAIWGIIPGLAILILGNLWASDTSYREEMPLKFAVAQIATCTILIIALLFAWLYAVAGF